MSAVVAALAWAHPRRLVPAARRYPLTSVVSALTIVAGIAAVVLRCLGAKDGRTPDTLGGTMGPLGVVAVTSSVVGFLVTFVAVVVCTAASERLLGWRRALLAMVVTTVVGTGLGALLQLFDGAPANRGFLVHLGHVGPWTWIVGTIVTASAFAGALWRRRIRVVSIAVVAALLLYAGHASDLHAALALVVGLVLGRVLRRSPVRSGWTRSSSRETRVLLVAAVTVSAVGPVLALVTGAQFGLLAPLAVVLDTGPTGQMPHCSVTGVTASCVRALAEVHPHGLFHSLLAVMPLVVLAVGAVGLRRGSRFALWLVATVDLVSGVATAVSYGVLPERHHAVVQRLASDHLAVSLSIAASVLVPIATAVVLVLRRADFPVRTDQRRLRTFVLTVAGSAVVLAVVVVGVAVASGDSVREPLHLALAVLGPIAPVTLPTHLAQADPALRFVVGVSGPLLWLAVAIAAVRPTGAGRSDSDLDGQDAARVAARALLVAGGGDTFGWMTTWPGNEYWFTEDGRAGVAYHRTGSVAVTTGGPFGHEDARLTALEGFARAADDHGWTPVFYGIDATLGAALARLGWTTLPVAEDADLDPRTWTTTGKRKQDVRTAVNKAARSGTTALWSDWASLPGSVTRQIEAISEEWVAERELPEMGFTLGGIDEMRDPAVRTLVALGGDGTVLAVTSWLPAYRAGQVVGWTLDVMRRAPDAPNGVMEFLVASAVDRMRADGAERLSLSAAPLASSAEPQGAGRSGVESFLDVVGGALEPVYGFRSLLRFKAKFGPDLHPLVMAYPDPVALPTIGVAIVRTYLPGLSLRQAVAIVRERRPARGVRAEPSAERVG